MEIEHDEYAMYERRKHLHLPQRLCHPQGQDLTNVEQMLANWQVSRLHRRMLCLIVMGPTIMETFNMAMLVSDTSLRDNVPATWDKRVKAQGFGMKGGARHGLIRRRSTAHPQTMLVVLPQLPWFILPYAQKLVW